MQTCILLFVQHAYYILFFGSITQLLLMAIQQELLIRKLGAKSVFFFNALQAVKHDLYGMSRHQMLLSYREPFLVLVLLLQASSTFCC